jgi:hypothetical protein
LRHTRLRGKREATAGGLYRGRKIGIMGKALTGFTGQAVEGPGNLTRYTRERARGKMEDGSDYEGTTPDTILPD